MAKRAVRFHRRLPWLIAAAWLAMPACCFATDVRVVAVTPGRSVDIEIDHAAPITVEVGETTPEGVRVLRVDRDSAVIRVDGAARTFSLVADHGGGAGGGTEPGGTIMLAADPRGQFFTTGSVNGRQMQFVVDTGATLTTLSRRDAQRLGVDYRRGALTKTVTANGAVNGWRVSLASVQVGGATLRDVDAIVVDNDMLPIGLLGMSFLGRFDMQRQGSTLVLRRRR
jgi:aspartyl protease family protein